VSHGIWRFITNIWRKAFGRVTGDSFNYNSHRVRFALAMDLKLVDDQ
jgi:hypothetical protein